MKRKNNRAKIHTNALHYSNSLLVLGTLFAFCLNLIPSIQAKSSIDENPEAITALAKCLKSQNATMYGTRGCGHCERQKEAFGPAFRYVRFIDCRGSGDNSRECNQAKVGKFPQWNFTNGRSLVREQTLDTIARASGCDVYVAKALGGANENSLQASLNQTVYNTAPASSEIASNNSYSPSQEISSSQDNSLYGSPEMLAKCLKQEGIIFYGSPKCGHCNRQKELFEGAFEQYLSSNFHNCKGSSEEQAECSRNNTFPFPTWRNPNTGKQLNGPEKRLEVIAQYFDCTLEAQARKRGGSIEKFAQQNNNQDNSSSSSGSFDYAVNNSSEEIIEQSNSVYSDSAVNSPDSIIEAPVSKPPIEEFKTVETQSTPVINESFQPSEKYFLEQKQNKLAKCIADRNIILYGITNESLGKPIQYKSTQAQIEELGIAAQKIKIVDCSLNQADCSGILVYPTWILDDKKELAGVYELSNLAQILNCDIDN